MGRERDISIVKHTLVPQVSFKKKILFFILNIILFFFRIFPVKQKKILFWSKNLKFRDNTKALFLYWQKKKGFEHIWLMDRKNDDSGMSIETFNNTKIVFLNSLLVFYHLSTAKYWIREIEVASPGLKPRKETIVVQLWHAAGVFKKFGLDIKNRNNDLKQYRLKDAARWDLLLCSSYKVADIYRYAFGGIDKEKILVTGLPRNDALFNCQNKSAAIKQKLGINRDDKLILYAPTFRDSGSGSKIFSTIISFLHTSLPGGFVLGVRLHPSVADKIVLSNDICNLTLYDTEPVLSITDMLITDYSSIIFDFALLESPMVFYSPDIDEYEKERGFYFDYSSFIPGPLSRTKESLIEQILNYDTQKWKPVISKFKSDFQPDFDGKNTERIFKRIMQIKK